MAMVECGCERQAEGQYVLSVTHKYQISLDFEKAKYCYLGLIRSLPNIYLRDQIRAVEVAFRVSIESEIPANCLPTDATESLYREFKTYLKKEGVLS